MVGSPRIENPLATIMLRIGLRAKHRSAAVW